jgi:predicted RND superfamily exporter protein
LYNKVEFRVTGTAHLFDKNIRFLTGNLVEGLAIEIALLALLMGIVYRSLSMIIIFMIPNLIPLFIIGAIMSFFQIELKTSTAIIFTIALGIAVDDTIHLLGKFRYELGKGKSKLYALKTAYLTTAKATIITTLVLCAGFMLLIFSSFVGAFNMGLLISITLFIAMIIDITLLPVLLTVFFKTKNK